MSNKPVFVATHPRACSTAFERVFMTRRNSLQTVHEPFGDAFYFGPERMSARYEDDEESRDKSGFAESTFKTIVDRLEKEGSEGKRVFIKDITYYLVPPMGQPAEIAPSLSTVKRGVGTDDSKADLANGDSHEQKTNGRPVRTPSPSGMSDSASSTPSSPFPYNTFSEPKNPTVVPREMLEKFHYTFLIRHPRSSIPSFYRCCIPPLVEKTGFNEFRPDEAGYDELRRFFDYAKDTGLVGPKVAGRADSPIAGGEDKNQIEICVIDADDLLDDPEGILKQYCDSIGLDFTDTMLNWNQEDQEHAIEAFEKWNGWHEDAIHSNDLKPRQHKRKPKSDDELYAEWVEKYGEDAAKMIKKTVDDNVADYEYLKQYALAPTRVY